MLNSDHFAIAILLWLSIQTNVCQLFWGLFFIKCLWWINVIKYFCTYISNKNPSSTLVMYVALASDVTLVLLFSTINITPSKSEFNSCSHAGSVHSHHIMLKVPRASIDMMRTDRRRSACFTHYAMLCVSPHPLHKHGVLCCFWFWSTTMCCIWETLGMKAFKIIQLCIYGSLAGGLCWTLYNGCGWLCPWKRSDCLNVPAVDHQWLNNLKSI